MRWRLSKPLAFLLLLAAASPSPRMATFLIEWGQSNEGKPYVAQVRGRNRVPTTARAEQSAIEGRLGPGDDPLPINESFFASFVFVCTRNRPLHISPSAIPGRLPVSPSRLRC